MKKIIGLGLIAVMGCSHASKDVREPQNTENVTANSPIVFWDLIHTVPQCSHQGEPDTFCSREDQKSMAAAAGMEKRVREILDQAVNPSTSQIVIAYFSFSNFTVFDKLCEKGKAGFSITGFFDNDQMVDGNPMRLKQCQGPSGKNVDIRFLGASSEETQNKVWRLHHNKFLLVDPDTSNSNGTAYLNFSSGNLSVSGLSVHFDHWGILQVRKTSDLWKDHQCVVSAMKTADRGNGSDEPKKYVSTLNACMTSSGISKSHTDRINKEEITSLFAPNANNGVYKELKAQIDAVAPGGKIYGAIQHFTHQDIVKDLRAAVKRGVDVRLIMDDDVVMGDSEVPGVQAFFDKNLRTSGIDIRFVRTNAENLVQMMHNKFLIFEKLKDEKGQFVARTFSGAGHFTNAAMRNNYENFYISQNSSMTQKYKSLFDYIWNRTLTEKELKK